MTLPLLMGPFATQFAKPVCLKPGLDNDEIRMTNVEGIPKSEVQMERHQVPSRRFGFRDSGFFRHWSFVIRISVHRLSAIPATEFANQFARSFQSGWILLSGSSLLARTFRESHSLRRRRSVLALGKRGPGCRRQVDTGGLLPSQDRDQYALVFHAKGHELNLHTMFRIKIKHGYLIS